MAETIEKNLNQPDETRPFPKGKVEVVKVGDLVFGKATFEPGWKWSECLQPIVGTKLYGQPQRLRCFGTHAHQDG